jgi:DNA-binding PucR family transcriptional regulator
LRAASIDRERLFHLRELLGHLRGEVVGLRPVLVEVVQAPLVPLANLDVDDAVRLAATLRIYLEERASWRRTAQRLGVHENTIKNRVRAAEERLGHPIDTRTAEMLVALRLARLTSGGATLAGS